MSKFRNCIVAFFSFIAISRGQTISNVLNAASYTSSIAPGTWVAIFGTQLAPDPLSATSTPLPPILNNVSVTVGGVPALLNYVSPTQINALVPFAAATLAGSQTVSVPVVVTTPSGPSLGFNITLSRNAPAIFSKDSTGTGAALAFDANFQPITTVGSAPLILYATGLGPTDPPAAANGLGATGPLNYAVDQISAVIGGVTAVVEFAGLAPSLEGIYQLNVVAPEFSSGNSVFISAGDYTSQALTLPIPAGTNVTKVTGSIGGLYPASGTALFSGMATSGPVTMSALLMAATFTTNFSILPGANPFQVVAEVVGPAGAFSAAIDVNPASGTWQATYPVPTAAARLYDFSGDGFTVLDFLTCATSCLPFPGNIVPLSRVDPIAAAALSSLPLPSVLFTGPNALNVFTGTLTAGGNFSITGNFGGFTNLLHKPGANQTRLFLFVDSLLVSSQVVNFTSD